MTDCSSDWTASFYPADLPSWKARRAHSRASVRGTVATSGAGGGRRHRLGTSTALVPESHVIGPKWSASRKPRELRWGWAGADGKRDGVRLGSRPIPR